MGFFYSVRGWLELDQESIKQVQVIIDNNEDQSPYTDSWHFPQRGGGFSRFVFFGSTVSSAIAKVVLNCYDVDTLYTFL